METIIKYFDTINKDGEGNAVELTEYNLAGIIFIPRVEEYVYFNDNKKHYVVSEVQHVFEKESDYETKHTIKIHLKQ